MPIWKLEKRRSRIRRDKNNNIALLADTTRTKTNAVWAEKQANRLQMKTKKMEDGRW